MGQLPPQAQQAMGAQNSVCVTKIILYKSLFTEKL